MMYTGPETLLQLQIDELKQDRKFYRWTLIVLIVYSVAMTGMGCGMAMYFYGQNSLIDDLLPMKMQLNKMEKYMEIEKWNAQREK